jgi:MFS family permease
MQGPANPGSEGDPASDAGVREAADAATALEGAARGEPRIDPASLPEAALSTPVAAGGEVPPGALVSMAWLPDDVGAQVRRTMRLSVVEGSLTQVFLNWTSGSVLIGYMLHLGASPAEIALVGSVPLLAQVASPAAAFLAAVLGRRKLLTVLLALVSRSSWLLAAALSVSPLAPELRPTALVTLVLIASLFLASNGTLWTAWMGDVVPERERGRYFGLRTGITGAVGMLANLAAGWWLDRVGAPLSFQVVLVVAVVTGLAGVFLYTRQYDPPTTREALRLRDVVAVPLRDPGFRRYLAFAVYWLFVVFLAAPFVFPYFLDELRLTFTQVAIWSTIAATTSMVTTIGWGRVADRVGNKAVLAIGTFVAGVGLPGAWILAGATGWLGFIWLSAVLDAIAWGAIGPAIFNLALVSAPRQNRVVFIAMSSLATGLAGFAGGALSGPLLLGFQGLAGAWGGPSWSAYAGLFALSGVLRACAWLLLRRVPEANAWRTRELLRSMRTGWKGVGFPWRS